jgi:Uma2 family endonuclease
MSLSDLDLTGLYSYADYLQWSFEERLELIKGRIFKMSGPSRYHQDIMYNLSTIFGKSVRSGPCKVYFAPFDVRLPRKDKATDREILTVVQPDLCVICDPSKLDDKGCIGAPDLIIEVVSPGNSKKEMQTKYEVYQEAGVKEYWIVLPSEKTIFVNVLNEQGIYIGLRPFVEGMTLSSTQFPALSVNIEEVFAA